MRSLKPFLLDEDEMAHQAIRRATEQHGTASLDIAKQIMSRHNPLDKFLEFDGSLARLAACVVLFLRTGEVVHEERLAMELLSRTRRLSPLEAYQRVCFLACREHKFGSSGLPWRALELVLWDAHSDSIPMRQTIKVKEF
jgi:hypothetical protein